MYPYAEDSTEASADRVRRHTALNVNEQIDRDTDCHIQSYINSNHTAITQRIRELDQECGCGASFGSQCLDAGFIRFVFQRDGQQKMADIAGCGTDFSVPAQRPGVVFALPILRRLGFRTRGEFDLVQSVPCWNTAKLANL